MPSFLDVHTRDPAKLKQRGVFVLSHTQQHGDRRNERISLIKTICYAALNLNSNLYYFLGQEHEHEPAISMFLYFLVQVLFCPYNPSFFYIFIKFDF
jgi:hypothetical protein